MSPIRPAVRAVWMAYTAPLEGVVPYFYQDVRGLVTIALGVLCDPVETALGLPLLRADDRPASRDEIEADWLRVKARPDLARRGHRAAREVAQLRLTAAGVEQVTVAKLDAMGLALARRFPGFEAFPADAQLAILSLAWACGTGFRFPRCEQAIRDRDWLEASRECAITSPNLPERSAAQRKHFARAALVDAEGLDPDRFFDPDAPASPDEAPPTTPSADQQAREAHSLAGWTLSQSVDEAIERARKGRE